LLTLFNNPATYGANVKNRLSYYIKYREATSLPAKEFSLKVFV